MEGATQDYSNWTLFIFIGLIVWVAWTLWNDAHFTKQYWVYACPQNVASSKCYKVEADYDPGYCDEGHCDPDTVYQIYFENGGYLDMDCTSGSKKTWTCYATNDNNSEWELQMAEVKKIPK